MVKRKREKIEKEGLDELMDKIRAFEARIIQDLGDDRSRQFIKEQVSNLIMMLGMKDLLLVERKFKILLRSFDHWFNESPALISLISKSDILTLLALVCQRMEKHDDSCYYAQEAAKINRVVYAYLSIDSDYYYLKSRFLGAPETMKEDDAIMARLLQNLQVLEEYYKNIGYKKGIADIKEKIKRLEQHSLLAD